jgi:hypothetical protein
MPFFDWLLYDAFLSARSLQNERIFGGKFFPFIRMFSLRNLAGGGGSMLNVCGENTLGFRFYASLSVSLVLIRLATTGLFLQ